MKSILLLSISLFLFSNFLFSQEREFEFEKDTVKFTRDKLPAKYQVDTRIDNMGYWKKMAEAGLVPVAPITVAPAPIVKTSKIIAKGIATSNSPDVPVTTTNTTQSENSIFASPADPALILNSNNSTPNPSSGSVNGADALYSSDSASTWGGTIQGPAGGNSGDPTTAISNTGRWFVGYINSNSGQSVAYSDNQGGTWTAKVVAAAPSGFNNMLDKNHMWIDNSTSSLYNGNLYNAWTTFGGSSDGEIGVSRSTDAGLTWKPVVHVSSAANAGSHNQGVNIKTGVNGEVYILWAIYDSWPSDEKALAIARSMDGGQTYMPAVRIIDNIKGIRNHAVTQNMRVNSFPSMAVDISNGPNSGNIYVVWTNVNTPGVNSGQGVEVYLIKSSDKGVTWSTPVKVNTDPLGTNKQHYLPWIACDPTNGNLAVVFYDNRNVSATQAEAWCAVSGDGGETFTDFAVSDVAFTPTPVPNLATGYMGDYLAITAQDGMVYPCWTDTRSGHAMTYVSPFFLSPVMNQAYIAYQNHTLNDYLAGNSNGTADYGENLLLTIAVKNIGSKPDTNVIVTLSCDSPLVTFTDSTENYGNFAIAETKSITDAFSFHISDSIANGTELVFNVKAVNNLDSVNYSYFSMNAFAPELAINNITINDPLGNNNHVLDPGETADVIVKYKNISQFDAAHPLSKLVCGQSFVTIANPTVNLQPIGPGLTDSAVFHVTVSNVPFGSAAQFANKIDYSFQSAQKSFVETIGLIVEDWETNTFTKFPWEFGGDNSWEMDNATVWEGSFAARSKTIAHNQTASLNITYNVMYDDSISFYRKVSSELFHDMLSFYIDGLKVGQWTGNLNWKRMSYPVSAGEHTFRWEYLKDGAGTTGLDAAWVDFIVFPPETKTMAYAGNNINSCENQPIQLNGSAANYLSLLWSTSGSGQFNNSAILNPIYTPSASDIAAGSVTITLSVTGLSYKESSQSSFVLTLNRFATANAGSDVSVCEGLPVNLLQPSATYYSALEWKTSGDGIFSDNTILSPVYTPGNLDLTNGSFQLMLTASTGNTCQTVTDTMTTTLHRLPSAIVSVANELCLGDSTQLFFSMSGLAPYTVVFDNGETRNIPSSPWLEWVKPSINTTYTLQSVTDVNGCINNTQVSTSVQIKQLPTLNLVADTMLCGNLTLILSANAQGAVAYLWTPGNFTTPSISVDTAGIGLGSHTYTLVATGSNGCKTSSSSIANFINCTGIDEMVGNVMFNIYPNPNNGRFAVEFKSKNNEQVNIKVANPLGEEVYSIGNLKVDGNLKKEFDLRKLAQGTYLLILENNKIQITKQLSLVK
jgi:uncharacterized repeat protein (TIGR01451 family)